MINRQGRKVVDKKKYNNGASEVFQNSSSKVAAVAVAVNSLQRFSVSKGFQM